MQPTIDPALLRSVGIALSPGKEAELIAQLQKTLEERVGLEIIDQLDDEKAAELENVSAEGDQEAQTAWIAANVPDYEQIVQDEYDVLMGEVAERAGKLATRA